jgi:hypothetical protein
MVVGLVVLAFGLVDCASSQDVETQKKQGQDDSHVPPPACGPGGQGGGMGGTGGAPACPAATTCPGTTSGRWCVETMSGQSAISLEGVWSDSPDDVWAVGWQTDRFTGNRTAVMMHWDGCTWTDVPNPDPVNFLYARGAWGVAPNDVWIVGDGSGALHFDGRALHFVPMPIPPNGSVVDIPSASGNASNDIWTGGVQVLHWDGEAWSAVPIDTGNPNQYFADVWSVAPNDVWVAGDQVVAHFDGSSWTVTQLISGPIGLTSFLYTIWSSGAEAWAAGPGGRILHFQGGQWTQTVAPTDSGPLLDDLGGLGGADVHLVGTQGVLDVLTEDTFVPVTDAPPQGSSYSSVWVSPSQVWVVGANGANEPLLIRRAR